MDAARARRSGSTPAVAAAAAASAVGSRQLSIRLPLFDTLRRFFFPTNEKRRARRSARCLPGLRDALGANRLVSDAHGDARSTLKLRLDITDSLRAKSFFFLLTNKNA